MRPPLSAGRHVDHISFGMESSKKREYSLRDTKAIEQRYKAWKQKHQDELDRQEKKREEQERERMRKLLIAGDITVTDMKSDKKLYKEYRLKQQLLDGGWVGNHQRLKSQKTKRSRSRNRSRRKPMKTKSLHSTLSTQYNTSQDSLTTGVSYASGYTSRTQSDIYQPFMPYYSLDVSFLEDQIHIPAGNSPRRRAQTAPVKHSNSKQNGNVSNGLTSNGNRSNSIQNGSDQSTDDQSEFSQSNYSWFHNDNGDEDDRLSRHSYAISESSLRAQTTRGNIRRNDLLEQIKDTEDVTQIYDLAESLIEPLRNIHLIGQNQKRVPKQPKKKMTMAALMR